MPRHHLPGARPTHVGAAQPQPLCEVCGPRHCPQAHAYIERGARRLVATSGEFPAQLPAHVLVTARLVLAEALAVLTSCCSQDTCATV